MISINDVISLTVWNLNHFLIVYFQFHPEFISELWCKIAVFIQYFSLEYSAWLLVLLTIDRYVYVRKRINNPNAFKLKQKGLKKTILLSVIVGFTIFILNSNLLVLNGYTVDLNNTKMVICYRSKYLTEDYILIWHRVMKLLNLIILNHKNIKLFFSSQIQPVTRFVLFNNSFYYISHSQLHVNLYICKITRDVTSCKKKKIN